MRAEAGGVESGGDPRRTIARPEDDAEALLAALQQRVEDALETFLGEALRDVPPGAAEPIREAVLAPGKRIRPLLLLAGYQASGGGTNPAAGTMACSVELVHAYSLIHDDLPCMDDDVLRRGRPTLHVKFGAASAVLAGAALMPLAMRAICDAGRAMALDEARVGRLARILTRAAGAAGMVGGQLRDLRAEGRRIDWSELEAIHLGKTAELMAAAAVMGGVAAGASEELCGKLRRFGRDLGLAFQVVDDILDRTGSLREMGKVGGRDAALGKATTPSVLGLAEAERLGRGLATRARAELAGMPDASGLEAIARRVVERRH